MDSDNKLGFPRPLYLAIGDFGGSDASFAPFARNAIPDDMTGESSFDNELLPILPAIWYALHLPSTRFDLLEVSVTYTHDIFFEKRKHFIIPIPAKALQENTFIDNLVLQNDPILILSDDKHFETAKIASEKFGFALPPVRVKDLNTALLQSHWERLAEHWQDGWPNGLEFDKGVPNFSALSSADGTSVALKRIRRMLGDQSELTGDQESDMYSSAYHLISRRAYIDALSVASQQQRDEENVLPDKDGQWNKAREAASRSVRFPMTLALPGVAPRYRKLVREEQRKAAELLAHLGVSLEADGSRETFHEENQVDPREALSLMVEHNTASDQSVGIVADAVPDQAFIALADLERYWVRHSGNVPDPVKESRLRGKIDKAMAGFWTEEMLQLVQRSTQIEAFTNFPIGLLKVPGTTAPLAALRPITYHPIYPLTRAFQFEFFPAQPIDFSSGLKVLVLECIPEEDPVGQMSQKVWKDISDRLSTTYVPLSFEVSRAKNTNELREQVAKNNPDVLVISAHGSYDESGNMARLVIGTEPSVGIDLGPMPPLVVLSACHTGPRGSGAVSVSDLLLRQGARAVLSTLVPVNVIHNASFMQRFLLYLGESIQGTEPHINVLDVWHRVQTSNVILDIIQGNPKLFEWGWSPEHGTPPVMEFMQKRSVGNMRSDRLYKAAEALLLEIALERGQESKVRGWLKSPGYVPESMMYTFIGDPASIRLKPSQLVQKRVEIPNTQHLG
ncbi:MAG: CHAT domain-containing protein [Glutamicibacter sp.]|uniref:CHAT domain-containing protein n=2 Tax=Glutamicibacter sp. TaxID=1931995 RepID=UPI002FC9845E